MTIRGKITTPSQQIYLTAPSQITGLNPQKTVHPSTEMFKSMPVFATNYTTNTTSPPLATINASKFINISVAKTATFAADVLFTSAAITLPNQSTTICTTTDSMKTVTYPSSESTKTTKMMGAVATAAFHPTTGTNFFSTPRFTKNLIISKTSAAESQSAFMKTSLFSTTESPTMSTTSWSKYKPSDIAALPISTPRQEFLVSTAARTVPWSTVQETSAPTTSIETPSAFPPESLLTSTAAPEDSIMHRNQTAPTLAAPDGETASIVHSVMPIETTPALTTVETELTATNFQDVSSSSMEDAISASMSKKTSSMALSSMKSSPNTGTQSVQTVIDGESTHTALSPGFTHATTVAETLLSSTIAKPINTENTTTAGEHMLTFISTKSVSTSKASESGPTSVPDETANRFSTNGITCTSRPGQTLLTSMNATTTLTFVPNKNFTSTFHGSTTNAEHSSTMTHIITPLEAATESKATTSTEAATVRYITDLFKLTSPWCANFSCISRAISVTNPPEFKLTTLLLKTIPMSTVAANKLPSIPRETVVPQIDISTLANIKLDFSTENTFETTQTERSGTSTLGNTTASVPKSATTQRFNATVTRKETTSHHLKVKSTIAAEAEVSPFSAILEATDEPAQTVTTSVTVSSLPGVEKLTTTLDNKTAITKVGGSWLSTKLMSTTPKSLYNGTTEIFNLTHTYAACWTSETPEGNSAPSLTSESTQTFPEPQGAFTTRILGRSFMTSPTDSTAISLSAGILPPQSVVTHSSAATRAMTHMVSLPTVTVSALTSMVVSDETKVTMPEPSRIARDFSTSMLLDFSTMPSATMTTEFVPSSQTASTTSSTMSTQRDSIHTTSKATVVSNTMTETLVPLLRPPTPVTAKASLPSTSADTVTPSTHSLICSKPPPDTINIVSSTHVISTTSMPVATQPISQVEETSTHALSFPNNFNVGGDIVGLATGTTQTSVAAETMPFHTSVNISQSSTLPVSTPVSTQLVTCSCTLSSDKQQMTISPGKSPRTIEVTEMSPAKNSISYSQGTSSLEITDTGFSETTEISSHQTHLPSETPLRTPSTGNSASSPISRSAQHTHMVTSNNTVDVHISEMSTSLQKTPFPSQTLTIHNFLSPEKESTGTLSVYSPRTVNMVVNPSSLTHPVSHHQATSFVDTTTSRTTRISNPGLISTTLSHLPSLKPQPEGTSIASSSSENTQTFPKSLSLTTIELSNGNFTVIATDGITVPLSVPNVPTELLGETSMKTSIPIYKMSSLPVNVTVLTSKNVSDIPKTLMTKSSKTTHPNCLKSPSIATSGPMLEMSSMPVNDSAFSPIAVSSDTSTTGGSFSTLSSTTPRTTMTIQTSTLDVTPMAYAESTSKGTMFPSAFTTSEVTDVSSRIIPTPVSSPTKPGIPSMKTISNTIMTGIVTSVVGTTVSPLLSSKNAEAIFPILKTTFSPLLPTTQQSPQGDVATTPDILPGITNSFSSAESSGRVTAVINTYSRTAVPQSVLSSAPSDSLHNSLNVERSPYFKSFKSSPGATQSVKATTTYLPSNTGKITSLSENTSLTAEITQNDTSAITPILSSPWTQSSENPPSLTSLLYLPHSTEAMLSTQKISPPPTSQLVEFPVLGTGITPSNSQSLLTTSWNTLKDEGSQFLVSRTTHIPTPKKMETEMLHHIPGTLSTLAASQTDLVSAAIVAMSSSPLSEVLTAIGLSESPSLSISSRAVPTTLADIKHTFENTSTSVTLRTTLPSNPSIISKATTSSMLPWVSSSFPSSSPLATVSNVPHVLTPSTVELSKSTFPTSDMMPMYPFIKFMTPPFATRSTIVTKTTPVPPLASTITGSSTSLPMSKKPTDDSVHVSTSPEAFSRATVTDNYRTVSQSLFCTRMSPPPTTTGHNLSIDSMPLPSPTKTFAWSRIPAESATPTLIPSKPTPDSFINIIPTTSTATRASFPLISTGVTHPSTASVSSLISSSFETNWLDSTSSFLSAEPLTLRVAAKFTVSFYNIEMNFSVFHEEQRVPLTSVINEFAKIWLNSVFQDSEFSLADMAIQINSRDMSKEEMAMYEDILEQRKGQGMTTISHVPFSCVCQVIVKAISSLASMELINKIRSKIHGNFMHGNFTQDQLMLLVKSENIVVKKLEPGNCKADVTPSKYKGIYKWLLTNPTEIAQTQCIKNEDGNATRLCSISIHTGKSQWEKPRLHQCKLLQELPDKIVDLANITISDELENASEFPGSLSSFLCSTLVDHMILKTQQARVKLAGTFHKILPCLCQPHHDDRQDKNADDVVKHILNLVNESPPLNEEETRIVVSKVADISKCDEISMNLTQIILQIINAVAEKQDNSASKLHQVSNEILRIIERVGHKMEFDARTANLSVARLAMAVLQVDHRFEGMAFSIRSHEEVTAPEIYLSNVPLEGVLASIYLPKSLKERIPLNNVQTILFNFFGQTSLFKTENITTTLTTYVVSASISNMSIQNLVDPVVITLKHIEGNQNYDQVHCAFWDFETDNGLGGWNSSGCKVKETNVNYTICQCDHLTHFGVLMDLSRSTVDAVNERILVIITYTGCGISSIFLGIAMVTYIAFHKLRKDYPSKILINLCTALLMLNLAFLVNSWLSSFQKVGLCITAAVALHYFLLVSLTWMGLEAVHMYFAFVKVFNIYIPNYILKCCLVGWGIPAITVAIILSVRKDLYGTLSPTTAFCWITDNCTFYISVVAYFCLIFLMNLTMFCTVLAQLNSVRPQSQKTRRKMILHDLKGTISLTFLLGLTWGFAFFAWGPIRIFFMYLFAICNTLQGFLIFVFYCVMKENVREQWHLHLRCRWLRLDNSSDGSSRYGVNVVTYKQKRLIKTLEHKLLTPSLKSTATCSTCKSISSAPGTPSEISFSNDDCNDDLYCCSPLSGEAIPDYLRRILPEEIKMNSIHKQSSFPINLSRDTHLPPSPDWGKC